VDVNNRQANELDAHFSGGAQWQRRNALPLDMDPHYKKNLF